MGNWLVKFLTKRHEKSGSPVMTIGIREGALEGVEGITTIHRYFPFGMDDINEAYPWYKFVNAFLHNWVKSDLEYMHDHPRWSITVLLSGELIEKTPWTSKHLKPGRIVIRSRKNIHRFELVDNKPAWTLFIVGRRKHKQNWYKLTQID